MASEEAGGPTGGRAGRSILGRATRLWRNW